MSTQTRQDWEQACATWLRAATPTTNIVIFEDEDAPRPPQQYVTLKVTTMARIGRRERRVLDQVLGTKCEGQVQRHYRGTLAVNAFGRNARTTIETIRQSPDLPDIEDLAKQQGLYLINATDTIDLTEIAGIASMPRFGFDMFFHYSTVRAFEGDVIDTVTINQV